MTVAQSMEKIPRIYFDGEARPNPGKTRAGIVVVQDGEARIAEHRTGWGNSHLAEWQALIIAARTAVGMGAVQAELIGDNIGVIEQANGGVLIRDPAIQELASELVLLRAQCRFDIFYLERGMNLAGRLLETGNSSGFRAKVAMCEDAEVVEGQVAVLSRTAKVDAQEAGRGRGC